jgi:hypothetical protein
LGEGSGFVRSFGNRWTWRGSNRLFMELVPEDLEALKTLRRKQRATG